MSAHPVTAGEAALIALQTLADQLRQTEGPALRDETDAVHQHRTAVRRMRSVLAAYRPLFDRAATERLRIHFAAWGAQLGVVRDIEVRAQVAKDILADDEDVDRRRRLVDAERAEYRVAHARLVELHSSPRTAQRLRELELFLADPPFTERAAREAGATIRAILVKEARRVRRAGEGIDGTLDAYHHVRKAARRLRYAVEAVTEEPLGMFGKKARALADSGERVHDLLGENRDALILSERLRIAQAHAGRAGERADAYDELIRATHRTADDRLAQLDGALTDIRSAAKAFA